MKRTVVILTIWSCIMAGTLNGAAWAAAIGDVAEIGGYTQIYQLDIPDNAAFDTNVIPYGLDNSGSSISGGISRIAYYLELGNGTDRQWIWISMDAFTQILTKIGVPTLSSGAEWQMKVDNMNVETNVAGIVTGTGITTGNIEFWPYNYGRGAALEDIGGDSYLYDFNDTNEGTNNYGSMQIHNYGEGQTLFAYNDWGGNTAYQYDDVGIGNNPVNNPDWTWQQNAGSFSLKSLEVWVYPVPVPSAVYLFSSGLIVLFGIARRRSALIK